MQNSLYKVIEYSILPAATIIISKLMGVFIVIKIENLPWSFNDYVSNIFSFGLAVRPEDIKTVATYSDFVMYTGIATLFSVHLLRVTFFSSNKIDPKLVVKLANKNLLGLITSAYDIYHASFVHLIYLWLATGLIFINVALGDTDLLIGVIAFVLSSLLTSIVLKDVYAEIEDEKPNEQTNL